MYRKRNSYDGEFCLFNSTSFKRMFNELKEKKGYTKDDLLDEIAQKIGSSDNTISGWLQGKTPVDGKISENGKLDEQATVVKLAKYFGIDVRELLVFPNRKEEKKMYETKELKKECKYNEIQIKSLKHLNDVIMEYMILKCHIMDKYADESNFMEYFDYSKLVGNSIKINQTDNEGKDVSHYKEKTKEEKVKDKNEEIARIEGLIKNEKLASLRSLWKHRLDNIDEWIDEKTMMDEREKRLMNKYSTDDVGFAEFLEEKSYENSAYGYVLFEIEKASTLLREEFIKQLLKSLELAYEIYDGCVKEEKECSIIDLFDDEEEIKELETFKDMEFKVTEYIKYLFAEEFLQYC